MEIKTNSVAWSLILMQLFIWEITSSVAVVRMVIYLFIQEQWKLMAHDMKSHTSLFLTPAGSFISVSPAGSFTSRYPQTGTYLDGFEAPSSPRYSFTDPITANMGIPVTFEAPELPEETLMEVRSRVHSQLWKVKIKESSLFILSMYEVMVLHQSGGLFSVRQVSVERIIEWKTGWGCSNLPSDWMTWSPSVFLHF